ncbi:MAG: Uma2 family endonuclease [Pseudanabaena sp.]|jgi:Uma2 family endonuclease
MTLQPLTHEAIAPEIDYPDSDGNPMSDNTEQFRWIVIIKENLEIMYANDPLVFVGGDLAWYPVRYTLRRMAPDVMVAFGRPKGRRGSYKQWLEDNTPPQVAFEILSPSNKDSRGIDALDEKFTFYETYGIQEYYIYDPDDLTLAGWQRQGDRLTQILSMSNWVSPLLGIRFDWVVGQELKLFRPDGQPFLSTVELDQQLQQSKIQVWQEQQRAEQERQRADRLAERLRALGIDPDDEF